MSLDSRPWIRPLEVLKQRQKVRKLHRPVLHSVPFRKIKAGDQKSDQQQNGQTKNCEPTTDFFSSNSQFIKNYKKDDNATVSSLYVPIDWSLKSRVRFVSTKAFPWKGKLKTSEEASGTTGFVRCIHPAKGKSEECSLDTTHTAQFYQHCLVWIFPSLPGIPLYPHIDNSGSGKFAQFSGFYNQPQMQEILQCEWCESLRSLYQIVRVGQCPYFYLCASNFTILFRAAGVSGNSEIHALISPLINSLKNALEEEGIQYTPVLNEDSSNNLDSSFKENAPVNLSANESCVLDGEKAFDSGVSVSDDACTWLESLGLSQDSFISSNGKRTKVETDLSKIVVQIKGNGVQALVNLLLTSISGSTWLVGLQMGTPPILLSPMAFTSATLQPLKMRQGWMKQEQESFHCIELSGFIMPHVIEDLCNLFSLTQNNYSASLVTYKLSNAFSRVHSKQEMPSAFAMENLKDCGLATPVLQLMCSSGNEVKKPVTKIVYENNSYNCT